MENKWKMVWVDKFGYYVIFNESLPYNTAYRREDKEEASKLKNKLNKKIRMENEAFP